MFLHGTFTTSGEHGSAAVAVAIRATGTNASQPALASVIGSLRNWRLRLAPFCRRQPQDAGGYPERDMEPLQIEGKLRRRAKTIASRKRSGRYGIVPLRMEWVAFDIEGFHLGVADLDALRVAPCIQFAAHRQTGPGRGRGNQFDHGFEADQGPASPSLGDVAEQPVLYLVPFRGPRRIMTYLKRQSGFVRQILQFNLEQSHA